MKEQQYLTHQRIHQAFELFDTDGSKTLNMSEITKALGGDSLAKNIMLKFDTGKVTCVFVFFLFWSLILCFFLLFLQSTCRWGWTNLF